MSEPDEQMSMLMRRVARAETISPAIAQKLAEMLFVSHYGKEMTDLQLPLVVNDHGDRWEVTGAVGTTVGQRLKIVMMKVDGKITEFVMW